MKIFLGLHLLIFFFIINFPFCAQGMGSFVAWAQLENTYEKINTFLPQKYSKKLVITPAQIEQYQDLREQLLTLKNHAASTNSHSLILKADKKIKLVEKILEHYFEMDVG
ncbi:MAG: hypothetical protein BWY54_00706 [Candidatus Dependentiae bacterium ADurb.Bin331]|nr:MAG: hypothetical protein BWY54_00706 [Candidatus Dependentiae bacterium ADurb.Bin331]